MMPEKKPGAGAHKIFQQGWVKDILNERKEGESKQIPLSPNTDNTTGYRTFLQKMYDTLPAMLGKLIARFADAEERELFLVGALGVISGMMPNYKSKYFGHDVGTNLYCFIIGRYGTGKGSLKWARMLGEAAHNARLEAAKKETEQYKREKAQYSVQMALYTKGKLAEPPAEPQPPRHLKLFIPANTTKTAVIQLLQENEGRGIMFETEGDTLADMLRQDYGNFSDILRKAYHHEALSFFRRADNEDVSVMQPELSVVLSGTHDQLLKLIPSIDNGLYSRFLFYRLEGSDEFKSPFQNATKTMHVGLEFAAEEFAKMYARLLGQKPTISFELTAEQQQRFTEHYIKVKQHTQQHISADLDGSVNRTALMAYRLAMIFTMLRRYETDPELKTWFLPCNDDDLDNALHIMDVLTHNATDVYTYLDRHGAQRPSGSADLTTDEQRAKVITLKHRGTSNRAIALEVFGTVNADGRVKRIINNYGMG